MIAAVTSAVTLFREGRKYLVVLAVLGAAAWLYVYLRAAEDNRDLFLGDAREICAAAGGAYQPPGSVKADWGKTCLKGVRDLAAFKAGTVEGSLSEAVKAMEAREGKQAADGALAALYAERTLQSQQRMEAADAAVENDRVGPGWAAAVNQSGGLR